MSDDAKTWFKVVKTWFKLEVIQKDIEEAACTDKEQCVIAKAINRTLSDSDATSVASVTFNGATIRFIEIRDVIYLRFHEERAFRHYLKRFDDTGNADPSVFIVRAFNLPARVVAILRGKGLLLDGEPATT